MTTLEARVTSGRRVLDVATTLPDGTEVEVVVVDEGDEGDAEGRALLLGRLAAKE